MLKVGDSVITKRRMHGISYGTIIEIRYYKDIDPGSRNRDDVYFYAVRDLKDKSTFGWSYNIFPKSDSIELDLSTTREKILEKILNK